MRCLEQVVSAQVCTFYRSFSVSVVMILPAVIRFFLGFLRYFFSAFFRLLRVGALSGSLAEPVVCFVCL